MSKGKTVFLVFVCLAIVTGIIFLVVFLTKPPEATAAQLNRIQDLGLSDSPSQWCMMPQGAPRDKNDTPIDYTPFERTPGPPSPISYNHADINKNSYYSCHANIPMYECVINGSKSFKNKDDCINAGREYNYCNPANRLLDNTPKPSPKYINKPNSQSQYDFCTKKITPKWKEQQKELPAHQQMSVLNK
jgi:hypothetical protein